MRPRAVIEHSPRFADGFVHALDRDVGAAMSAEGGAYRQFAAQASPPKPKG